MSDPDPLPLAPDPAEQLAAQPAPPLPFPVTKAQAPELALAGLPKDLPLLNAKPGGQTINAGYSPDTFCPVIDNDEHGRALRSRQDNAFDPSGSLTPGLLNLAKLLKVGSVGPDRLLQRRPGGPAFGDHVLPPSSSADIIVTILHKHNPTTLRAFFECPYFDYTYDYVGNDVTRAPTGWKSFRIQRRDGVIHVRTNPAV